MSRERKLYDPAGPANGPVGSAQSRPRAKLRPRGRAFDASSARAAVQAREARRAEREARREAAERGEPTESALQPSRIAGVSGAPGMAYPPRIVEPLDLGDLVLGADGVLRPVGAPRSRSSAPPAPSTLDRASAPQPEPAAGLLEAPASPSVPEPARPSQADQPAQPAQPAKLEVKPGDPRWSIAMADWATLRYRLAKPQMAAHMLPWRPRVSVTEWGAHCGNCGAQIPSDDHRAQHAIEAEIKAATGATGRLKCVAWALGLPLGARP